jgi:hypothetical protein
MTKDLISSKTENVNQSKILVYVFSIHVLLDFESATDHYMDLL